MNNNKMIAITVALTLQIGTAYAVDPPVLQEGLWLLQMKEVSTPGNKTSNTSYKVCRDHSYDKAAEAKMKSMKGCTVNIQSTGSGKYSSVSHCVIGATTVASTGTMSYQGNTVVHVETTTTFSPAMAGISGDLMVMDQKYLSSCPAGMKPGDMMTMTGVIRHR